MSEIGFQIKCVGHRRVNPITCYCLALNGQTILIKAHSVDNNTIYVYKYNLLNWFFYSFKIVITLFL
jgi:hypothetical protein